MSKTEYHCTRIDTERDNEGRVHLVAYGHSTRGCDDAGCAGHELRLGRIEEPYRDERGDEWADIDGDLVALPFGTVDRIG